jgi:hypothetical protein
VAGVSAMTENEKQQTSKATPNNLFIAFTIL